MKRVLVTGGAGFIGSTLINALLARGDTVVALDNFLTGTRENLQTASACERFRLVVGDIRDETLLDGLACASDVVVHLAARIGLKLVVQSPLETLETNVRGSEIVLNAATRYRCRTLVASSSEVYGLSTSFPSRETDPITIGSPRKGRWSYASSKAIDEFLALALFRERDLPSTVVRLFNTVGPGQSARYGMVLPRLVGQALAGEPLTVYGDGSQTRSFCHVDDVVGALVAILDTDATVGDIYNLGNPHELTIGELARRIIAYTGSASKVRLVSFEAAYGPGFEEIVRRIPDITKLRDAIGFEPRRGIEEIIASLADSLRPRKHVA